MKQSIYLSILITALVWSLGASATNTYKWVDKDGNVHYSQKRPESSNYEKMKIKTAPGRSEPAPVSTPNTSAVGTNASKSDSAAVLKKEVAKNEDIRKQNCDVAKKNLQAYTVYRRVRMPDGSVRILADDERAKLITESKASIKEFCDE